MVVAVMITTKNSITQKSTETGFISRVIYIVVIAVFSSTKLTTLLMKNGNSYDLYVVDYNADGREDLFAFREQTNVVGIIFIYPAS